VIRTPTRLAIVLLLLSLSTASPVLAQGDAVLRLEEPDFTLVNLPTSLRLPLFGSAFRVQHRFVRPLDCDTCPDSLLEDFFGIDNGAVINLEYRIGVIPNGQVTFSRARVDKTIQFLGMYGITRQGEAMPLEISAIVSVEGTDNFRDVYSPSAGILLTRLFGERGAAHVEPLWVGNSRLDEAEGDDNTLMLGLGARVRISATVYLVGEATPRLSGYRPGTTLGSFGVEKRVGGHMFQLNFSNYFGSTLRQIAQGALNGDDWYMGFNISRKFF
jgi:hypothetical protein